MYFNTLIVAMTVLLFSHIPLTEGSPMKMPGWMRIRERLRLKPNVILFQYNSGWWNSPDIYDVKHECTRKFKQPSLSLSPDKCDEVTTGMYQSGFLA
jgi:hypothetical protein